MNASAHPGFKFGASISRAFKQYATFKGRALRSEFWWFALFCAILALGVYFICIFLMIAMLIGGADPKDLWMAEIPYLLVQLVLFLPGLSISVRRLHDIGKSGWNYLLYFIPIYGLIVFIKYNCKDSQRGTNKFGPSLKYPD